MASGSEHTFPFHLGSAKSSYLLISPFFIDDFETAITLERFDNPNHVPSSLLRCLGIFLLRTRELILASKFLSLYIYNLPISTVNIKSAVVFLPSEARR